MNLTYIPSDKLVVVDGRAIQSDYVTPPIYEGELHAVVWSDTMKEYQTVIDGVFSNIPLQEEDYTNYILPLWQQWESQRQVEDNPVIEPLPFLEQKQIKINLMNSTYEQYISAISTETDEDKASYIVPQTEVATFDMQKLEAEAWQIDDSVATPFIDGIALGRQMDRVLLIQKVLAKAMGYSQYVSVLTGKRQHIEDLLKQAHTQEALDAIDIEALYN